MKFTVKRSEWYRGQGSLESKLLRKDGKRCCIGFVGQQCGVADSSMLDISSVALLSEEARNLFPKWLANAVSDGPIGDAYETNDDNEHELWDDEVRETRLATIFKANGDEIEFVD